MKENISPGNFSSFFQFGKLPSLMFVKLLIIYLLNMMPETVIEFSVLPPIGIADITAKLPAFCTVCG